MPVNEAPNAPNSTTSGAHRALSANKHIIALCGAKGGVGRSTLAVELAKCLARRDRRVLIVDFSAHGCSMSALLECEASPVGCEAIAERAALAASIASGVDANIRLLTLKLPPPAQQPPPQRLAADLMQWLRRANVEWVLLDLPTGSDPLILSLSLSADLPLLVSTPEPASLAASAAFLQASLIHALRQHPSVPSTAIPPVPFDGPWRWPQLFSHFPEGRERDELLPQTCAHVNIGFLVNQSRESSEAEQVTALCHAWGLAFGVWPRAFGTVQFDDRRWFFTRKLAPPAQHVRDDSMGGDIDSLARSLLGFDWLQWAQPRACLPVTHPKESPRAFLDLSDVATSSEAQQRYRRLWEAYRRDAGLVSYQFDEPSRHATLDLLDQAHRSIKVAADTNPSMEIPALPSSALNRANHHPGQTLRMARMRAGLGMRELSLRTRVGVKHIEAIESGNRRELPARVYLKAYLTELARALGLEPEAVVEDYIERLDSRAL